MLTLYICQEKITDWPALVVELKWNKSADSAIEQILRRHYPDVLKKTMAAIFYWLESIIIKFSAGLQKNT